MNDQIQQFVQSLGFALEIIGVFVIVIGFIIATVIAVRQLMAERAPGVQHGHDLYRRYRQDLARSILIGLEFLVAGDIIRTVSGDLTLEGVAILGGIVLIRIMLGLALEAEIDPEQPSFFARFRR